MRAQYDSLRTKCNHAVSYITLSSASPFFEAVNCAVILILLYIYIYIYSGFQRALCKKNCTCEDELYQKWTSKIVKAVAGKIHKKGLLNFGGSFML